MTIKEAIIYKPQSGPQEQFLASNAAIVFYGGAAGSGKTFALILDALSHIEHSNYRGALFVSSTFVFNAYYGKMFGNMGGAYSEHAKIWTFTGGAEIYVSPVDYESHTFDFIGIDDVNRFSEEAFWLILSRLKRESSKFFRPYARATCNADRKEDSWLRETLSWWIALDGDPIIERSGKFRPIKSRFIPLRHIINSLTFIPATIHDNKILLKNNPEYLQHVESMLSIDKDRLLHGSWKIYD